MENKRKMKNFSDEIIVERLKKCFSCIFIVEDNWIPDVHRCLVCGCCVETIAEIDYKKCPRGLW